MQVNSLKKTENKKIAIIVSTLSKGGAERVAANMSLEFAKHYDVLLIVHDAREITYSYGGKMIDLQLPPANGIVNKIITLMKRVRRVRKIKKQNHVQFTISHLPMCNYVNIFSRYRDKVITYMHTMETPSRGNIFRERLVTAMSDVMVCVSECARQNMIRNFGISEKKLKTIYNFCDISVDFGKNDLERIGAEIVNMGRLVKEKGQWHLIRAMKKVHEKYADARLTIYGEGELREALELLVEKMGLEGTIYMPGYIQDPYPKIAQADIYANPAEVEGLPMALIEAGNCGVAIISTDCDAGCREILAPSTPIDRKTAEVEFAEYGILVPVCNDYDLERLELSDAENKLADGIIRLIEDKMLAKAYSEKALERAAQFRAEHIMGIWTEVLC